LLAKAASVVVLAAAVVALAAVAVELEPLVMFVVHLAATNKVVAAAVDMVVAAAAATLVAVVEATAVTLEVAMALLKVDIVEDTATMAKVVVMATPPEVLEAAPGGSLTSTHPHTDSMESLPYDTCEPALLDSLLSSSCFAFTVFFVSPDSADRQSGTICSIPSAL
jgi:hypothetical protein